MTRTRLAGASMIALLAVILIGCQQPQTDLAELMKAPERPAELDHLNMFVGRWEGTGEIAVPGSDESMTSKGVSTAAWDADNWLLVERSACSVGDDAMVTGLTIWTWDTKARKYRLHAFDNYGYTATGTATYDDETKTWHIKGKSHSAVTGETSLGEGKIKIVGDDTMEWDWAEWDTWKLRKLIEVMGTSRRK